MLIIAETKIDNSFPDAQFKIDNYITFVEPTETHMAAD
jgi:hypothetical protein